MCEGHSRLFHLASSVKRVDLVSCPARFARRTKKKRETARSLPDYILVYVAGFTALTCVCIASGGSGI